MLSCFMLQLSSAQATFGINPSLSTWKPFGLDDRVGFIRLSRTEAGLQPAESSERKITMTYWRLHYHLIWSTMDRQPMLTPKVEKMFYGVIYGKAEELDLKIHAAG